MMATQIKNAIVKIVVNFKLDTFFKTNHLSPGGKEVTCGMKRARLLLYHRPPVKQIRRTDQAPDR